MAYKKGNRPYKHEYQLQLARGEHEKRMERQRARREYDKKGIDRKGKDIDHIIPLKQGGKNKGNTRLISPSKNRSCNFK